MNEIFEEYNQIITSSAYKRAFIKSKSGVAMLPDERDAWNRALENERRQKQEFARGDNLNADGTPKVHGGMMGANREPTADLRQIAASGDPALIRQALAEIRGGTSVWSKAFYSEDPGAAHYHEVRAGVALLTERLGELEG